jgi:hypothetical protein
MKYKMATPITLDGVNYQTLAPQGTTTTLSGQYIVSDASNSIITDVANDGTGLFVAPFISRMYADASGSVGVIQQTTVQVVDIDRIFNIDLTESQSKAILAGFKITDNDVSGNLLDSSFASVVVSMSDASDAFITALAEAIASNSLIDNTSTSLTNWLQAETRADVRRLLSYDTLANMLEASDLLSFGIALDASNGATNMWTEMASEAEGESAARRRALFTQLTESRIEKYALVDASGLDTSNERVTVFNFLPLLKGDKLAFVFDVIVGQYSAGSGEVPTVGALMTRAINDNAPGTVGGLAAGDYIIGGQVESQFETGTLVISKPTMRRVAVQLRMEPSPVGDAFAATRTGDVQAGYTLTLA